MKLAGKIPFLAGMAKVNRRAFSGKRRTLKLYGRGWGGGCPVV